MRKMLALFLTIALLLIATPTVFAADVSYSVGQSYHGVNGINMEWHPNESVVLVFIDDSWWDQNEIDTAIFALYEGESGRLCNVKAVARQEGEITEELLCPSGSRLICKLFGVDNQYAPVIEPVVWEIRADALTVTGYTRQELDDDTVRFTLDYETDIAGMWINVFDPPNGAHLSNDDFSETEVGANRIVFDVPQSILSEIKGFTISFHHADGRSFWVYYPWEQTNDEPTSFTPEHPTDLTAFGDLDLHQYLLSLNPDEVNLGPNKDEQYSNFDSYYYDTRYLEDTIADKLKEMYPTFRIVKPAGVATMEFYGTRVETSYYNEHFFIHIETFYGAGKQYTIFGFEF